MKSDARIRYTKMVIKNCFIELLKKMPLNKISVKDLCEAAEINRATFYSHYNDCFDLLRQIEDEMLSELQMLMQDSNFTRITDVFTKMFTKIKDEGEMFVTVCLHGDSAFPDRIINICYDQKITMVESLFPRLPKYQNEWLYYFSATGCSGILRHWITSGMKEDASELASFIADLFNKIKFAYDQSPDTIRKTK